VDETFRFTYSNGETNESVWPGESMHTLTGLFPPKTGAIIMANCLRKMSIKPGYTKIESLSTAFYHQLL